MRKGLHSEVSDLNELDINGELADWHAERRDRQGDLPSPRIVHDDSSITDEEG